MRPSVHETYMEVAKVISKRSTCARRQVGCVLLDSCNNVLATGYNGVERYVDHCIDKPCEGAFLPSGTGLDKCQALHAEQNALIRCADPESISTVICTTIPCMHCIKMLSNTNAMTLVYSEDYPTSEETKAYWLKNKYRHIVKIN